MRAGQFLIIAAIFILTLFMISLPMFFIEVLRSKAAIVPLTGPAELPSPSIYVQKEKRAIAFDS